MGRWLSGLALAALVALIGCGNDSAPSGGQELAADRFDSRAAYRLVEEQVEVGQRPAGSAQLRGLAVELRGMLPEGEFEAIPGELRLRNVVGRLPGDGPAIVVGAHYDTLVEPEGFVGANNGAAGTAVVVEVARALAQGSRANADGVGADDARPVGEREVVFVLFDGEEPDAGLPEEGKDFYNEGLRGSRAYVAAHPGETGQMVLLDYVGNEELRLPREATSTESLWERLRHAADAVGAAEYFPDDTGPAITDDHTPFLRSGVPAIDLIDWSYPGHDLRDGLDKISVQSLDAVGETVIQLVEELRDER
jgi:glutaminyl-peptide cyclotransferase